MKSLVDKIEAFASRNWPLETEEVSIDFGHFLATTTPIARALQFAPLEEKAQLFKEVFALWYSSDRASRDGKSEEFKMVFGSHLNLVRFSSLMITDCVIKERRELAVWYGVPSIHRDRGRAEDVAGDNLCRISGKTEFVERFAEVIFSHLSEHQLISEVQGVKIYLRVADEIS